MKRIRLFLLPFFYFSIIILASVYGVGCNCGMDTTGVGDGENDINVSTFSDNGSEPEALPSVSVDTTTATVSCGASSTTSGGLTTIQCPDGEKETLYVACDNGDVVIASASSGNGTKYDCSGAEIVCNDSGEISSTVANGCTGTTVDVGDYTEEGISDLPEGLAVLGTLDGGAVQVSDSEVSISISKTYLDSGTGSSSVILSIGVSNESSSSSQKVLVNLSLSNATVINSFTVGTTYELNAAELGVAHLGSIRVTSTDGTTQTYLIDSALLQFSELNDQDGGTWSGIMQVNSSSSNTELTVDFSGTIFIPNI